MRVMVLIRATPQSEAGHMPSTELLAAMGDFNQALADAGVLLSGEGLKPSSQGARVNFDGDRRTTVKGPFRPESEQVAGYWVWQVRDMVRGARLGESLPQPDVWARPNRDPPAV